jgi:uncharacterized protein
VAWLREGFEHPGREDDYWARRDFSQTLPQVTAPVSFVGGWQDILVPWMLDDFIALQAAGRSPRLLIGPWVHTSPELLAVGHRDAIAWLRAHLLGDDRLLRGDGRPLPVRLFIGGPGGGWRDVASWPPPGMGETRLHLRGDGWLREAPPAAGEQGATDGYRYDPADPTPAFGGPILMSREPVVDNAPLEARDDVLTFTTEPLDETVEVIGRPVAELWARGSVPYFDLFARVCEVGADGVSRNLCDALASVHPDHHAPEADGSFRVRFELWPLGHRFAPGSRIRLLVCSGAHPRYARNPGTGEDPAGASPAGMRAVDVQILRDADHPSAITLPTTGVRRPGACDPSGDAGPA